jgi:hypothetical protein
MIAGVEQGDGSVAREPGTTEGRGAKWSVASFLLALIASFVLLLAPLGNEVGSTAATPAASGQAASPEEAETRVTHPSLLETQGWSPALPLSVPVVLTGFGVLAARRGWRPTLIGVAVLLGAGIVLAALSIGFYYLPAEAAMIVAFVKGRRT